MKHLEITNNDLIDKIRTDAFMRQIYDYANKDDLTEVEMLSKAVVILLNLKEEAFQEKVDKLMRSPRPLLDNRSYFTR
jgi:hypothetical protein